MAWTAAPAGRLSVKPRTVRSPLSAPWSSLMNWEVGVAAVVEVPLVEVDSVVVEVVVVVVVLVAEVALGS